MPHNQSTSSVASKKRKIHVDLPEEIHKKLRVKAALQETSMQAFVARVVGEAVRDIVIPNRKPSLRGKRE